ncbi:putative prephenate dehydratase [[Candida] railenensis]|uniref:prephenate dehydratase n=1 Tax=[Candida] railenensis TaxID=45579 RepID=A0A9P0QN62_9ASCO|nr:putative prephenate dehydratase [[Candida] railenensis]
MSLKVAYLGPQGTYTYQATVQQFPDEKVDVHPQKAIADCFQALHDRRVDYAVVPFENSTNGQVVYTYDLLRDWFSKSDCQFQIVGEQFVSINHYVLSRAKSLDQVTKIYSHPQVWGQVTSFTKKHLAGSRIVQVDCSSTSRAAELVYQDDTNTTACISSKLSADIYKLPVMYPNVEDIANNTTRFLVLGYEKPPPSSTEDKDQKYITSVLFTLNHNDPGALCTALDILRRHGIDMTSINSRPSHLKQWQYVFFVEMQGCIERDANVRAGLTELGENCSLTVLGSFERNWRYNGA